MNKALSLLRKNVSEGNWGYHPNGPRSTEPAALACLALIANDWLEEALPLASWLAELQSPAGSVGVTQDQATPAWPTSLAILAWQAHDQTTKSNSFSVAKNKALQWALQTEGRTAPQQNHIGHDTTLVGWSWAAATHSWLEPTCLFVLALRALGRSNLPRAREGVRLIIDRQLEQGGCNYGNTRVLGQATLPHVQPTGLAMLAIADEPVKDLRIARSLNYLKQNLQQDTTTASLCYGLLGLTAHQQRPLRAERLLNAALARELQGEAPSFYKLALLTLAGRSNTDWLPRFSAVGESNRAMGVPS